MHIPIKPDARFPLRRAILTGFSILLVAPYYSPPPRRYAYNLIPEMLIDGHAS
jgi:hypothetical protein